MPTDRVTRRRLLCGAGVVGSAAVAGCTDGLTERLRSVSDSGTDLALRVEWTTDTGVEYDGNHHGIAATTVGDETVIAAPINDLDDSAFCGIVAVDADGSTLWDDRRPPAHCNPHAVGDLGVGSITGTDPEFLVAVETGDVFGYDPTTGDRTFSADVLDSIGYSSPVGMVVDGQRRLVVVDFEGLVVATDSTGTIEWQDRLDGNSPTDPLVADFDGDGRPEVAVSTHRPNRIVCFDADGTVRWTRELSERNRSWTTVDRGETTGVAVTTYDGDVLCLDHRGDAVWSDSVGRRPRINAVEDAVYTADHDGTISAFDAADGAVRWRESVAEDDSALESPAVGTIGGISAVAVTGFDGSLTLCDPEDGTRLARGTSEVGFFVPPVFVDDGLVAFRGDGRLTRIGIES
ncbi:MAG: PQQ-binding-like beta-propeller repeat protein [Natronomonas sp.]